MEFQDVLSVFDIKHVYSLENSILGLEGFQFHLKKHVAFMIEKTRAAGQGILFINQKPIELSDIETRKIHSIIRLNQIKPQRINEKRLYLYSMGVKQAMQRLIQEQPRLEKSSAHMAFSPRNYTRFSENLLFDFDYIYDTSQTAETITNFPLIWEREIKPTKQRYEPTEFTADELYRYLLDQVRTSRISINGKISAPEFLHQIYRYCLDLDTSRLALYLGPEYLIIRTDEKIKDIYLTASTSTAQRLESENYQIIYPDNEFIADLLKQDQFF